MTEEAKLEEAKEAFESHKAVIFEAMLKHHDMVVEVLAAKLLTADEKSLDEFEGEVDLVNLKANGVIFTCGDCQKHLALTEVTAHRCFVRTNNHGYYYDRYNSPCSLLKPLDLSRVSYQVETVRWLLNVRMS